MEYRLLKPSEPAYPRKLLQRMGKEAPTLYYHGPLKLLDRFTMAVIAADSIPAPAMQATNDLLFKIREYALNYIGPWHSVWETEIFRLAIYTPNDPQRLRSLTMLTARGMARENWDDYLNDRFGYSGPFRGFPEKEEYYRRAKDGELLVLSITEPDVKRLLRENILLRNWVACALADVVFVPFAEKGTKTYITCKLVVKAGLPAFTCQYYPDRNEDPNKQLFELGIPSYNRKTVGPYLDSLGASTAGEAPFPEVEMQSLMESSPQYGAISKSTGNKTRQAELWERKSIKK
ncbi:MAG: hypothetical protein HY360_08775 [Verrucomicrobia bacterium]|nr:hypothetical protein [Verrucomicrobiota bacterium]